MNINSNDPLFYLYSILVNKCKGSVIILMIHMLNYAFQMLLKTWILTYLN